MFSIVLRCMGTFYDVANKEQAIYSGCNAGPLLTTSTADNKTCLCEEESF